MSSYRKYKSYHTGDAMQAGFYTRLRLKLHWKYLDIKQIKTELGKYQDKLKVLEERLTRFEDAPYSEDWNYFNDYTNLVREHSSCCYSIYLLEKNIPLTSSSKKSYNSYKSIEEAMEYLEKHDTNFM